MIQFLKENKLMVSLLCLAALLRLAALFAVDSITDPQVWEYEEVANNLLEGQGLSYHVFGIIYRNTCMILYPLLCAFIYRITHHSFLVLKLVQIAISLASCFLIYSISKKLFGKRPALIALLLMAVHPGFIIYAVKLHPLSLDMFMFIVSVFFFLYVVEGKDLMKNGFLAGICIGIALLTRATIGLFVPLAAALIIFRMRSAPGRLIKVLALMALGISLILLPLIVRNFLVFHRPVLLPNDSACNFWTGNHAGSLGTGNRLDGKDVFSAMPDSFRLKFNGLDEFRQKDLFYNEGARFIKEDPKAALVLFLKKLSYFWWFSPTQGLFYPKDWLMTYKAYYFTALFCALLGIFFGIPLMDPPKRQMLFVIILFCAAISIAQALYYVEGRHRWAIEPFILMLAACGIDILWSKIKRTVSC